MAYYTPQVRVYQEFNPTQNSYFSGLSACLVGKLGNTYTYDNSADKEIISLGNYTGSGTFAYPGITTGSVIDADYTKLFIDNAELEYKLINTDFSTATIGSEAVFGYASVSLPNAILFNGFSPATNGNYSRDASLGDRDVQIGDKVVITAHVAGVSDEACTDQTFESTVRDYVVSVGASSIGTPCRATSKGSTYQITGLDGVSVSSGTYTGSEPEDIYFVRYTGNSTDGWEYSVSTQSGRDCKGTTAAAEGTSSLSLGQYLTATVSFGNVDVATTFRIRVTSYTSAATTPARTSSAYDTALLPLTFDGTYSGITTGNITERIAIRVVAKYNNPGCEGLDLQVTTGDSSVIKSTVAYTVDSDPCYAVEVTDGLYACILQSTSDSVASFAGISVGDSWEYSLSGIYTPVAVSASGTYTGSTDETFLITCTQGGSLSGTTTPKVGVTTVQGKVLVSSATLTSTNNTILLSNGITITFDSTGAVGVGAMMALGDIWTFAASSGKNAAVTGLILRDEIPAIFRSAGNTTVTPLKVSLRVVRNVEVTGFTQDLENEEVTIEAGLTANQDDFLSALTVVGGEMYLEYREWLSSTGITTVASLADLDTIPGKLTTDNPLKYGVYKALTNSNGAPVQYVTVQGDTLADWEDAIATLSGTTEAYVIVPLTSDVAIMNLVNTLVNTDSTPESCAWKEAIFSTYIPREANVNVATNNNVVLATIRKPIGGTRYTQLDVTSGNADFIDKVQAGDIVTIGGEPAGKVDSVDFSTRLTLTGNIPTTDRYASAPQAITIVHPRTKNELVAAYVAWAQSFASRRVTCTYPGYCKEAGSTLPGYYATCAVAGLRCGVNPWQGLTRVEIAGFDDLNYDNFNVAQLRKLSEGGVWVITEDSDGTPYTLHAVTTNMSELNYQEESITRNMDSISFALRNILDTYIGRYNVTNAVLNSMRSSLNAALSKMVGSGQVIGYSIVSLEQDALLRDTVNCTVNVLLPYAVNVIELHIVAV